MSLLEELKRRSVFRVGIAYVVVSWLAAQVLQLVFETFGAPDWVMKILLVVIAVGFPVVLFIAWAFELTPEGVKRDRDVDRTQPVSPRRGKKLDGLIVAALVLALGYIVVDKFVLNQPGTAEPAQETTQAVTGPASGIPDQSIAVLPFVNMSEDKDYFADGLSEELLNLLANIPGLKVAGRTSSFAFKGKNENLKAIGDALGVANVLEGSVRRSGERLRITAQLVKVDDGFHIWSETYDRQMADIFDIQDDVAQSITRALKLHLSPAAERPTENTEAYALYLQALAIYGLDNVEDWSVLLDRAIALDPEFAKAWELKAYFYWLSGGWSIENGEAQLLVYESAKMAVELDPGLDAARALLLSSDPESNSAGMAGIGAFETLALAEPDEFYALDAFSWYLLTNGYFQETINLSDRMIELEPLDTESYFRKGEALSAAGRIEEAELAWKRAASLGGRVDINFYLGVSSLIQGKDDVAITWLEKYFSELGMNPADVRPLVEQARDPVIGQAAIDAWIAQAMAAQPGTYKRRTPFVLYLGFGYLDAYWAVLDSLQLSPGIWSDTDFLVQEGIVFRASGYCRHPRYLSFAKEDLSVEVWETRGPPDHCRKAAGDWVCE